MILTANETLLDRGRFRMNSRRVRQRTWSRWWFLSTLFITKLYSINNRLHCRRTAQAFCNLTVLSGAEVRRENLQVVLVINEKGRARSVSTEERFVYTKVAFYFTKVAFFFFTKVMPHINILVE